MREEPKTMMPSGIGVIDLMMGTRAGPAAKRQYEFMRRGLKDEDSRSMNFPAQYKSGCLPQSPGPGYRSW